METRQNLRQYAQPTSKSICVYTMRTLHILMDAAQTVFFVDFVCLCFFLNNFYSLLFLSVQTLIWI